MGEITTVTLTDASGEFVSAQVKAGEFASADEAVAAALRLLEHHQEKLTALRQALIEGEESGSAGPLDMEEIKRRARAMVARAF